MEPSCCKGRPPFFGSNHTVAPEFRHGEVLVARIMFVSHKNALQLNSICFLSVLATACDSGFFYDFGFCACGSALGD
jgi:hypothetical protein